MEKLAMYKIKRIVETMKNRVSDLETADALFHDVLNILSTEQLNVVEDLVGDIEWRNPR